MYSVSTIKTTEFSTILSDSEIFDVNNDDVSSGFRLNVAGGVDPPPPPSVAPRLMQSTPANFNQRLLIASSATSDGSVVVPAGGLQVPRSLALNGLSGTFPAMATNPAETMDYAAPRDSTANNARIIRSIGSLTPYNMLLFLVIRGIDTLNGARDLVIDYIALPVLNTTAASITSSSFRGKRQIDGAPYAFTTGAPAVIAGFSKTFSAYDDVIPDPQFRAKISVLSYQSPTIGPNMTVWDLAGTGISTRTDPNAVIFGEQHNKVGAITVIAVADWPSGLPAYDLSWLGSTPRANGRFTAIGGASTASGTPILEIET